MRILLVSRIAAASSVNRKTASASASASASAKTTASNRINNKTNGRIIVTTTKFLFAVVVVVVATRYFSTATTAMTAIHKNTHTIKKVFCFGDSLTAGTSPPYERELFPYATYLEEALRTRSTSSTNTNIADADADAANIENNESNDNDNNACHLPREYTSVVVRWKGFPGWQASTLRDDGGLATIISNLIVKGEDDDEPPPPPLDLIVILAGTNDLAYEDDSSIIVSNIQGIHKIAHSHGCQTISLGIPPSGWQLQDSSKVGNIADEVNEKLQSWCCDGDSDVDGSSSSTAASSSSCCSTMVTYVPFPIKEFDRDSCLWAPDGLHLSPEGYKTMGVSLSPIIANILNLC